MTFRHSGYHTVLKRGRLDLEHRKAKDNVQTSRRRRDGDEVKVFANKAGSTLGLAAATLGTDDRAS